MRITFLLPVLSFAGGNRVVAIYADWLSKNGHEVTLISREAPTPKWRKRIKHLLHGKEWLKHTPRPRSFMDRLNVSHHVVSSDRDLNANDVPEGDVLICTWWETAEWANALPTQCGARVYFIQHHEIFAYLPRERVKATYLLPYHKITIAQWLVDVMNSQYGDHHVDLVANAVDHGQFYSERRKKNSRPTIGMLYHAAEFKGVDTSLKVIVELKKRYPSLRVIAFGSTKENSKYRLPKFVELHVEPMQEAIRHIYASCDVWLTTSRSEGFNLMAMESMACRTPVVSTRTGWPIEAIRDGENGYLIDIDHVDEAVHAVSKVLDLDDSRWLEMSDAAWNTVSKYNWTDSCRRFENALFRAHDRARKGEIVGLRG